MHLEIVVVNEVEYDNTKETRIIQIYIPFYVQKYVLKVLVRKAKKKCKTAKYIILYLHTYANDC